MTGSRIPILAMALALFGCATPPPPDGEVAAPPQRIVLHYDFAGDWAATAGDGCAERLDLSDGVFLSIAGAREDDPTSFHVAGFFMLEEARRAEALVGHSGSGGALPLRVETEGVIDGRPAAITYDLTLRSEGPRHIRLTGFVITVRDGAGETVRRDLLAAAAADRTIPVLSEAGRDGLCLKRL